MVCPHSLRSLSPAPKATSPRRTELEGVSGARPGSCGGSSVNRPPPRPRGMGFGRDRGALLPQAPGEGAEQPRPTPTLRWAGGPRQPLSRPSLCHLADLVHFDIPSIHVELGPPLRLSPLEHARRHSVTEKRDSEEESESTAL